MTHWHVYMKTPCGNYHLRHEWLPCSEPFTEEQDAHRAMARYARDAQVARRNREFAVRPCDAEHQETP